MLEVEKGQDSRLSNANISTVSQEARRWMAQDSWDQEAEDLQESGHRNQRKAETVVHDMEWYKEDVNVPIGGHAPRQFWSVRAFDGEIITEDGGIGNRTPYDCFLSMFPFQHLLMIEQLTPSELLVKFKME